MVPTAAATVLAIELWHVGAGDSTLFPDTTLDLHRSLLDQILDCYFGSAVYPSDNTTFVDLGPDGQEYAAGLTRHNCI